MPNSENLTHSLNSSVSVVHSTYFTRFKWSVEYDQYRGGNLWYVGINDYVLYCGHTWAWEHVQFGLIGGPASRYLPLPYVYWRF